MHAQAAEAAEAECRGELEGVEAELREISARMSSQPQQQKRGKRSAKRPGAVLAGEAGAERGGSEEADAPPAHAQEERRTKRRR